MATGNIRLIALLTAAVVVVALGSAMAAEGDGDELAVGGADGALVEQLLALEPDVPDPLPSSAELTSSGLDALLGGSFASARSALDGIEEDLRTLYISADDAGTAVGDAVADVTRGLLIERQGLLALEETDDAADPRPLDSSDARDENGTAIDADGYLGITFTGIDLLVRARDLQRSGYEVLQGLPEGVAGADVFAARLEQLTTYRDETELTLLTLAGAPSGQLLVPVDRFDAPLGVAAAVDVSYVCVDREAYLALAESPMTERLAGSVAAEPDAECAAAARRAGLGLDEQQVVLDDGATTGS